MQAYLIDPHSMTTEAINYSGNWQDISKLIGAQYFDVVTTPEGFSIYVDDEGLYVPDQAFFMWKGLPVPLAGKALVLGPVDQEGYTTACPLTLDELSNKVVFGLSYEPERMIITFGVAR